jgi:hypothetical protein
MHCVLLVVLRKLPAVMRADAPSGEQLDRIVTELKQIGFGGPPAAIEHLRRRRLSS